MNSKNIINILTSRIIGCAMEVRTELSSGYQEVIYQRCLEIELIKAKLEFERELSMDVVYKGEIVGRRRVDFFVENKVLVELKAVSNIENFHLAQIINYCEIYNIADGLLINFGSLKLQVRRVYNKFLKM